MAAAGSYHKLPDPDELIECPYDKAHVVRFKKLVYHLMKCRQNHPSVCVTCPFDARHQVPRVEFQLHLSTCPQRALVERDVAYHLHSESSTQRGDVSVPPYDAWQPPEPVESWSDDDDGGASSHRESWTAPVRDRQSVVSVRSDADNSSLEADMRDLNVRTHMPNPCASTGDRGVPMRPQDGSAEYRGACAPPLKNESHGLRLVSPSPAVRGPHEVESPPDSNVPRPIQPLSAWSKPLVATGASGVPPVIQQPTPQPDTKLPSGIRHASPSPQGVTPAIPFGLSPTVGRGRSSVRLPATCPTALPAPGRPQEKETRGIDIGRTRIAANFNRAPVVDRTVVESPGTATAADSASSTRIAESSSDAERAAGDQQVVMQQKLRRIDKKLRQISELEKKEHLDEDQKRKLNEKSELEIERDRITQELKKLKNS